MGKCEWCATNVDELMEHKDARGDIHYICKDCMVKVVVAQECRKCKSSVAENLMVDGLCQKCQQAKMYEQQKKKEEDINDDANNHTEILGKGGLKLQEDDVEQWLALGNAFSFQDFVNNKWLRCLWAMFKLNAVGIYDNELIFKHIHDIETLVERNIYKLKGNKCKLVINYNETTKKMIDSGEVIDHEESSYLIKA